MNNKVTVNAFWIMFGRVFQLGLTFITSMLITRYLGPADYGKMNYVYSYIQLFIPLAALGMNDIVVKELVDHKDDNDKILGTILVSRICSSLICMFCSVMIVSSLNSEPIYRTIAILQSFALMFQSFECLMYFYQSKLLSRKSGTIYALAYILTAVYRLAGIFLKSSVYWFSFGLALDFIVLGVLLLAVYLKDGYKLKFSFETFKYLFSKSYHYMFAGLLVVLYGKVTDTLLLGRMIDEEAVGYYSAAYMLVNAWPFVLTAIIDSLNPIIVETHQENHELYLKKIKQLYAIIFYVSIVAAIAIGVLAKFIITILYGSAYEASITPLRILSWSTAFAYLGVARTSWMQCENKTKYETLISLIGAICSICLNFVLIRYLGIIGASIAAVLTQFIANFVFLFFVKDLRENAMLIGDAIMLKGVFDKEDNLNV
ncbi:MAG: flippase [Erysipelotrichaceae bacterium]|nr:flippase [Erysipelotrichaceae bacterium]